MKSIIFIASSLLLSQNSVCGFTVNSPRTNIISQATQISDYASIPLKSSSPTTTTPSSSSSSLTQLQAAPADLDVVALVAGQENYGLAVVAMGEAIWSFVEAPSLSHAKVLIPASIAALILVFISGPMVTNVNDAGSIGLGLEIATGVSVLLGLSYVARMLAPYSPSAKEIAFLGLLVSIAGFFSFSQNLVVDGFVQLPSIPLPTLPSVPAISLPNPFGG